MRLLLWLLLPLLAGCLYRGQPLQMIPEVLDRSLTRSLQDASRSAVAYDQLDRIGRVSLTPLSVATIRDCQGKTGSSYRWLPAQKAFHYLLILDSDETAMQKIQGRGWQVTPEPRTTTRLKGRETLAQVESLLPEVTPWSSIYLLGYATPLTTFQLQYGKYKLQMDFR